MTRGEARELLRDAVLPVILGNSPRAHGYSLRLFLTYGIRPIVCGEKRGILDIIDPFCDFLRLYSDNGRLTLEQLSDLSERGGELIMHLVPISEDYEGFVKANADELESRFILRSKKGDIFQGIDFGFER